MRQIAFLQLREKHLTCYLSEIAVLIPTLAIDVQTGDALSILEPCIHLVDTIGNRWLLIISEFSIWKLITYLTPGIERGLSRLILAAIVTMKDELTRLHTLKA